MPPSRSEHAEKLYRALFKREAELKAAREDERRTKELNERATVKRESLEAAVKGLRETVDKHVGAGEVVEDESVLVALIPKDDDESTDGRTIAERIVDFLEATRCPVEAREISQAVGADVDVVRTTLSKLRSRGKIARPRQGEYCALPSVASARTSMGEQTRGGTHYDTRPLLPACNRKERSTPP
jgi:hypothetical protein